MNIENPTAFSFIMQDDIYLLNNDKSAYNTPVVPKPDNIIAEPEPEYMAAPVITIAEPKAVSFDYFGGHKRNFLVIVHYPEHEVMHDTHLTALESTLTRLGFTRDDVAIFNRAKYLDAEFNSLVDFFKPQKLLLLGKSSLPAATITFQLNKLAQVNGNPALLTFSFDEMMDSVEKKKAFWEQMKQL